MPMSRGVARFNRDVANHVVRLFVLRSSGFGVIHHVGRKSGRAFETPVKLFRHGGDYLITLPYGPQADWVRNVLAAGGCDLVVKGRRQHLTAPTLHADDGRAEIPAMTRRWLRRIDATDYLTLTPVPARAAGTPRRAGGRSRSEPAA